MEYLDLKGSPENYKFDSFIKLSPSIYRITYHDNTNGESSAAYTIESRTPDDINKFLQGEQ